MKERSNFIIGQVRHLIVHNHHRLSIHFVYSQLAIIQQALQMFATTNKRLIYEYHRKSWPTYPHFKCQGPSPLRCIAAALQINKLNTSFFTALRAQL
jgi:hypothetical protein